MASLYGRVSVSYTHLVQAAEGKVDILVGSGVQAKNLAELASRTGAKSFHLSAKKEKDSAMAYRKTDVHMGLPLSLIHI